jgi:hypothetical protein
MPTLLRLLLGVLISTVSVHAGIDTPIDRVQRIFPFEIGQQYQFKAGGDFTRPNGEVLPAGQVAEITITDTVIAGNTYLHIPYWSPWGLEYYRLDVDGTLHQWVTYREGHDRVFLDPSNDGFYWVDAAGGMLTYQEPDLKQAFNYPGVEPALLQGWSAFASDSGYVTVVSPAHPSFMNPPPHSMEGGGLFGFYGGTEAGSCLHGMGRVSDEQFFFGERTEAQFFYTESWGLFRPKSNALWPDFKKPSTTDIELRNEHTDSAHPHAYLHNASPNPFNPSTKIVYGIVRGGHVRLAIYNVLGQRTRTLVDRYIAPGSHTVIWDGVGDTGDASASGVYVVRLEHVDREGELRSNSQTNSTERRVRRVTLVR